MKKEYLRHRLAYLLLVLVLSILAFLFFAAWPDRLLQRIIVVIISVFYFLWGIFSHIRLGTITKNIILEYLAVSGLSGLILFLITL
ncbi:MAG: hypothetical protein ACOZAN_00370 [Patescibacteria group bacterium]